MNSNLKYFFLISFFNISISTIDLNIHELQYVADHLTAGECRKLVESLHDEHFILFHNVTGEDEPVDVPCIDLLREWEAGEGKDKTFLDIATRLREMGRPELADFLSKTVYHEKSEEAKKAFLLDPFKNLIHTDSPILEESVFEEGPTGQTKLPSKYPHFFMVYICVSVFAVLVVACSLYKLLQPYYCPKYRPCSRNKQHEDDGYVLMSKSSQSLKNESIYSERNGDEVNSQLFKNV